MHGWCRLCWLRRSHDRHELHHGEYTVAKQKGGAGDGNESIAGYFRGIFKENPQLLKERSNEELLRRWQEDHPGQAVSKSVKVGLSNIKSVLRSRRRKKAARKEA